jgi:hypothetical protein
MIKSIKILLLGILIQSCNVAGNEHAADKWSVSVLPPSIRLDPSTNLVIDDGFDAVDQNTVPDRSPLKNNWIYDGRKVSLHGARGEYISFQLVLINHTDAPLKGILVDMPPFKNKDLSFNISPEFFLEWAVEVKTPSTGYSKASLGTGWYPDALIPFDYVQMDSTKVHRRWIFPLELPDFNNRIDGQQSLIVWVDQYIPFAIRDAAPGTYSSVISVTIGDQVQRIPVELQVWDFAIPNENRLKASLQHEGFLSRMDERQELETYQLFKRNRISLMDPTYKPGLDMSGTGKILLDWDRFDARLQKYFTGEAFTRKHGYADGPGYGEPLEAFILPFNVFGKHGDPGWPDTGKPDVERNPENIGRYREVIREVRNHLQSKIDPQKTELTVYLNGLDESYFPEAWDRMVYYGEIFKEDYPEVRFRIDGSYSEEAMAVVKNSIKSWASHTINYDIEKLRKYQEMGIEDWLYGPMLYESKVNSWVGSSTFIDLPLVNDRAISWSCWKYNTYSWISWGVGAGWERAWYDPESWKDTYKTGSDSDAGFTYKKLNGNGLLIYSPGIIPNVNGACPSIRLKMMRNGVQEYEYMRLLSMIDGNKDRATEIVNGIIRDPFGEKSIGNLDVWSYDAEEWDKARIKMGELIHKAGQKP